MGKTIDTKNSSARLAAAVIVAGLVMSGCSAEEPEPDFKPTMPPSKSSSALDGEDEEAQPNPAASPDLKPPPIPPEIEEKTLEGAEAAARYYIDAFNYGYAMRDSEPMKEISLPECETCQSHIELIETIEDNKQIFDGGFVELEAASDIFDNGNEIVMEFPSRQEPFVLLNPDGSIEGSSNGSRLITSVLAAYENTSWKIRATSHEMADER